MNTSLPDVQTPSPARIPVTVSGRHVHLTQSIIEQLFCDKYRLHEHARVSQPTQFAALETVTLFGPRGRIANVRVIGPARDDNQVEISRSDALVLGVGARFTIAIQRTSLYSLSRRNAPQPPDLEARTCVGRRIRRGRD
jgi:propanediol utilization protein